MSEISNTETAILGLLYEHHHFANRLEEIIEKRAMRNWADLKYASIDEVLNKLEKNDLIKYEIREIERKSSRNVYFITDKGKQVFLEKIKELMSNKSNDICPFDLAIDNMGLLDKDEVIESLNAYLKSIDKRIEFIDNSIRIQEENNIPYNFIAILHRNRALLKAERVWIGEFNRNI